MKLQLIITSIMASSLTLASVAKAEDGCVQLVKRIVSRIENTYYEGTGGEVEEQEVAEMDLKKIKITKVTDVSHTDQEEYSRYTSDIAVQGESMKGIVRVTSGRHGTCHIDRVSLR